MSVNWDKYASTEDTRQQAKNPNQNAVVRMPVDAIRRISPLKVKHTPDPANRAHSEVFGFSNKEEQLTEIRVLLRRIAEVVIPLTAELPPAQ